MKTAAILALTALLGGCAASIGGLPEAPAPKLVAVTKEAPPPVFPAECYVDPGRFPDIPVAKDAKGVPGSVVLGTLNAGREAHRTEVDRRLVCRAAIEQVSPKPARPSS